MLKGKKILVTGAAGFIDSHLVEALLQNHADVRAFIKYNGRGDHGMLADLPTESLKSIEVIPGDIRDPFFVRRAVKNCDYVFHLAALIGIPYSYRAPQAYVNTNVVGTLNLLEACRQAGVNRLIHTSTSEVYGTARATPMDEDHPLQAQSPYAATKIAADKLVETYGHAYDLPVVTLRPFNNYGPRQSARAVIPTVITQALDPDCETVGIGSTEPVRDWLYVADTVEAFLALAEAPAEAVHGRLYHIGSGRGISIGELVEMIFNVTGRRKPLVTDPARVRPAGSEVRQLVCNAERIRNEIGWQPRVGLEQGLKQTADWIGEHLDQYRSGEYTI